MEEQINEDTQYIQAIYNHHVLETPHTVIHIKSTYIIDCDEKSYFCDAFIYGSVHNKSDKL